MAWLIAIFEGRIVSVTPGPFVTPSWALALRASEAEWQKFWLSRPPPGSNDLMALIKRRELKAEGDSLCTMELEPNGPAVKLSITHTIEREPSKFIAAVSAGWPKVISNLKSLLETGSIALQDPYPTGNPDGRR